MVNVDQPQAYSSPVTVPLTDPAFSCFCSLRTGPPEKDVVGQETGLVSFGRHRLLDPVGESRDLE